MASTKGISYSTSDLIFTTELPDKPNLTELNLLVFHVLPGPLLALPHRSVLIPVPEPVRAVVGNIVPFCVLNLFDEAELHEGVLGLEGVPLVDAARSLHHSHALEALVLPTLRAGTPNILKAEIIDFILKKNALRHGVKNVGPVGEAAGTGATPKEPKLRVEGRKNRESRSFISLGRWGGG